jgi:hypothetical protein
MHEYVKLGRILKYLGPTVTNLLLPYIPGDIQRDIEEGMRMEPLDPLETELDELVYDYVDVDVVYWKVINTDMRMSLEKGLFSVYIDPDKAIVEIYGPKILDRRQSAQLARLIELVEIIAEKA